MVMVVTPVEVDGAVVAVMVMPLVAMAVAVAMVMMVVQMMVVAMARTVIVPLRGCGAGEEHEGGGDQACDAELHGMTLVVRDDPRLRGSR
jgi:hypothetical protein